MNIQNTQKEISNVQGKTNEKQQQMKLQQKQIISFQSKSRQHFQLNLQDLNQKILNDQQSNSFYYVQRSAIYFSQSNYEEAINNLKTAANLDHLNPIIYYNIGSIQFCQNHLKQALKNFYCGVSCLFLKRAIIRSQQIDTHRAIKNCPSNVDAKIVLIVYLIRDKKYYLAHRQIKSAIQSNPEIQILYKIKNDVESHLKINSIQNRIQKIQNEIKVTNKQNRLIYEQQISENIDIAQQVRIKLKQFKQLYNQIYGDFTQKSQQNSKLWILNQVKNQQITDKNEKDFSSNEEQILLLESKEFINNLKLSPLKRISKDQPISQKITQNKNFSSTLPVFKKTSNQSPSKGKNPFDFILTNCNNELPQISISQHVQQNTEQKVEISRKISNKSTSDKNYQDDQILQDNTIKIVQIIAKQCQFFIQSEKLQNMKNIYIIIFLNNHQNKFNTQQVQCKPKAVWNQTFEKDMRQQKLQKIKVKIMNKQLKKIRDDFIGQGQIEINKYGSLKFPIYNKETVRTGLVYIELKKIYKKIQENLLIQ